MKGMCFNLSCLPAGDSPTQATVHLKLSEPGLPLTKHFEVLATLAVPSQPCVRVEQDARKLMSRMCFVAKEGCVLFLFVFVFVFCGGRVAASRAGCS